MIVSLKNELIVSNQKKLSIQVISKFVRVEAIKKTLKSEYYNILPKNKIHIVELQLQHYYMTVKNQDKYYKRICE